MASRARALTETDEAEWARFARQIVPLPGRRPVAAPEVPSTAAVLPPKPRLAGAVATALPPRPPPLALGGQPAGVDTASYDGNFGGVFVNLSLGRGYTNFAFGDTYLISNNLINSLRFGANRTNVSKINDVYQSWAGFGANVSPLADKMIAINAPGAFVLGGGGASPGSSANGPLWSVFDDVSLEAVRRGSVGLRL